MLLRVLIPVVLIAALMIGVFVVYRRKIDDLKPDADGPSASGTRLTAERLRSLPTPPWRVVHEIPPGRAGDTDHVVVGPAGVFAIRTELGDRPRGITRSDDPTDVANAAIRRADVEDYVAPVGGRCHGAVTVYWGAPSDEPAGVETTVGAWAVEGQRLVDWLMALPPSGATPAQLEQWWQQIVVGVGRPDPLT